MTLIELLVVVVLVLMLLGVAIPLMKPALDRGRIREAARQVNAYFAAAQARATQLGRPAGVWLQRRVILGNDGRPVYTNACLELFPADLPPIYAGDFPDARVQCTLQENRWLLGFRFCDTLHGAGKDSAAALVGPGEHFFIRFDFKGPLYRVVRGPSVSPPLGDPSLFAISDPTAAPPPAARQGPVPFQVYRSPTRTTGGSLQLTGGAIIDMEHSGIGIGGTEFKLPVVNDLPADADHVVVMFSPGGGVDRLVYIGGVKNQEYQDINWRREEFSPVGPLHLLLGRLDRAEPINSLRRSIADAAGVTVPYNQNLANPESIWISLGHRTGLVSTSQNVVLSLDAAPTYLDSLGKARELALNAQTLGGR